MPLLPRMLRHMSRRMWLLVLLPSTAWAADLFALTAVNVRDAPSTAQSRVIGKLAAGERLSGAVGAGEWTELSFQGRRGFVRADLVGLTYFPTPMLASLLAESRQSWLLAYNAERRLLAVLHDHGWDGAVDGPYLRLRVFDCANKDVIETLDLPTVIYGGDANPNFHPKARWQQTALTFAWNEAGLAIQALLQRHGFAAPAPATDGPFALVEPAAVGLAIDIRRRQIDGQSHTGVDRVAYRSRTVWQAGQHLDEGSVADLASVVQVGRDFVRVNLATRNLDGCCDDTQTLVLDLATE